MDFIKRQKQMPNSYKIFVYNIYNNVFLINKAVSLVTMDSDWSKYNF